MTVVITPRIWKRVDKRDDGCWLYASTNSHGYAYISTGRRRYSAHRLFYEALAGPIPEGLELDHLCRNKACVNPAHLEPVTHAENVRRGEAGALQRSRTHCANGHRYEGEHLYLTPAGHRACRTCNREACARYRDRRREAVAA